MYKADHTHDHDRYLEGLYKSDELGLGIFVCHLSGNCGEEKKRQDKDAAGKRHHLLGGYAADGIGLVGYQNPNSIFKYIVIEGAAKLGIEKRPESTCSECVYAHYRCPDE